ncbi:putative trans-sialidase, partial [Trypanosoma cruzi]
MTCLRLISGSIAKQLEGSTVAGHVADRRAFQVPNFDAQVLLPIVWGGPGVGGKQWLVIAERQILGSDYTRAVADVQNWTARIYFQTEEALNYRSARET